MRKWMRLDEDVDCSGLSLSYGLHMTHYDSHHRFTYKV